MTRGRETDAGDSAGNIVITVTNSFSYENLNNIVIVVGHHSRHHKNDVASVDLSSFYVDIEEDLPLNGRSLEARGGGANTISRPMTSSARPSTSMQRPKTASSHNFSRDRDREQRERSRMGF